MTARPLQVGIVYGGDNEVRRLATPREQPLRGAVRRLCGARVDARPAVYNREQADEVREQLLASTARWSGSIRSKPGIRARRWTPCCAKSPPRASSSARTRT